VRLTLQFQSVSVTAGINFNLFVCFPFFKVSAAVEGDLRAALSK
jgi:hypothetical protein